MINLVIGIILLVIPFLLLSLFSDKKVGFLYILFLSIVFQTLLGITTQYFGIFYFGTVSVISLVVDSILILLFRRQIGLYLKEISFKKIDWVAIIVLFISIVTLYQVHYNYTGKANLVTDQVNSYHQVNNMRYIYPYFSDEWYSISLVEGAIQSHNLPIRNILDQTTFINLEMVFHSFVAEIMLILGLNYLTQYVVISLIFNTLIVFVVYLFLRINKISNFASAICSLLLLYITCGANLPGLWNFMPFSLGLFLSILGFSFMSLGDLRFSILAVIATSFFYPPILIFSFLGFAIFLFLKLVKDGKNIFIVSGLYLALLFLIITVTFWVKYIPILNQLADFSFPKIFFTSLVAPFIPKIAFYDVIPIPAILLSLFGLFTIFKEKKWLFFEFIFGIFMWIFYSSTVNRFFIEYERVAIFTSIMAVIISGYGLNYFEEKIKLKFKNNASKILKVSGILILSIFLFLTPFYTTGENWMKIIAINPVDKSIAFPKSPANNYLTKDDIEIFKDIKGKKFLSLPWKGTVIGVAFNNYPFLAKEGNISMGDIKYLYYFMKPGCETKTNIATWFDLDYVYLYEFDCPDFEKVAEGGEGLILYKFED